MRTILLLSAVVASACGSGPAVTTPAAHVVGPPTVTSNIARADYAGSSTCGDCHAAIYTTWQSSPMRNMTRDATVSATQIRAPFDGASLQVGGDLATMTTRDGARFVTLARAGSGATQTSTWRVTKVIGGRYREDFAGIDVSGAADPLHAGGVERILPATYVFATKSWRYKGYSVMVTERPSMSTSAVWSHDCIPCHNTLPYLTMLYDPLYGPGLPGYQGKAADGVLPPARTWSVTSRDDAGLARALTAELRYFGAAPPAGADATPRALLPEAAKLSERRLDGKHVVELGVGCEACHNGGKEHVADATVLPTFAARSPDVAVAPPPGETGTRAQWINHTCARCHTVLFTHYDWTWEGGKRSDREPGGSSISSGEGRDYQLGGCASQMACTTCHDPHTADPPERLAALATPAGNALCMSCHPKFAAPGAVEAHAHHKPGSAGTACIACHMAKKNMGLDYALDRYHRIGSPDDPRRVEGDRPLECALCHQDKSVGSLVTAMERWWGKRFDRARLAELYGPSLDVNAIRTTLAIGKPHEQAVAIAVLGEAHAVDAVPAIAGQLAHDYPLVRYFAQRALQTITGDPVAIDVGAPAAQVRTAAAAWLASRPKK